MVVQSVLIKVYSIEDPLFAVFSSIAQLREKRTEKRSFFP